MQHIEFHVHKRAVVFVIVMLLGTIAVLAAAFVDTYEKVGPERVIGSAHLSGRSTSPRVLGADDVSSIAPWMTFDYINHVFGLPAGYLRSAIGITDARYPELIISNYAKEVQGGSSATLTTQVQSAVRDYFSSAASR